MWQWNPLKWFGKGEDGVAEVVGDVEDALHHPIYPIQFYSAVVDEGKLTRGAWPSPGELATLRASGCKAVVNLCAERQQDDEVRAAGVQSFNIPLPDNTVPSTMNVHLFLAVTELYPTYVHCEAGKGRTGCMVAAYRVKVMGWTPMQALLEAEKFGLSLPSQREFILNLSE